MSGTRIEGLNRLVRSLQAAGVEIGDLKAAFSRISTQAADLAARYAPRNSGKLRASIRGDKAKNKATVRAGGRKVPYAGAINYGWQRHNIAPQRFMQKADDAIRPEVPRLIESNIRDIMEKAGLE